MIPFEPKPWEDEQRDYLDKREEVEASAWIGAAIVLAIVVALAHEAWSRLFA